MLVVNTENDDLLTPQRVAELFLVHPVTLARWRLANRGPAWIELEGQIRYRSSEVQAYLKRREKGAPNGA